MKTEIGAYEAKTKLPELLRLIAAGQEFTITNRGKPIADLVAHGGNRYADATAIIDEFLALRKTWPVIDKIDLKALIEEGRE